MKVLITGSEGLIGTELKRQLSALSLEFLSADINLPKSSAGYADICVLDDLKNKVEQCDGVVHLAAVSRVIWGEQDPKKCWATNVDGTNNILELAKNSSKKPWVIYASSREVYGQQDTLPVAEDVQRQAVNIYANTKIAAEDLTLACREHAVNTAVVRFSNVFGNIADHVDRVVPAFAHRALLGEPLFVEGADNLFDFTYVRDVVSGLMEMIKLVHAGSELPPIHFTSGESTSLGELAKLACDLTGNRSEVILRAPRNFDVARFYGDTTRAKSLLNWQASTSLRVGLEQLINDYRQSDKLKTHAQQLADA